MCLFFMVCVVILDVVVFAMVALVMVVVFVVLNIIQGNDTESHINTEHTDIETFGLRRPRGSLIENHI